MDALFENGHRTGETSENRYSLLTSARVSDNRLSPPLRSYVLRLSLSIHNTKLDMTQFNCAQLNFMKVYAIELLRPSFPSHPLWSLFNMGHRGEVFPPPVPKSPSHANTTLRADRITHHASITKHPSTHSFLGGEPGLGTPLLVPRYPSPIIVNGHLILPKPPHLTTAIYCIHPLKLKFKTGPFLVSSTQLRDFVDCLMIPTVVRSNIETLCVQLDKSLMAKSNSYIELRICKL
jgi:hypothetical protein